MFRGGLAKDEALERSAHAAFMALEDGVRCLFAVPAKAPLAGVHGMALLSIWSVVHGFAHLALAGQFDRFTPPGGARPCCAPPSPRCSSSSFPRCSRPAAAGPQRLGPCKGCQ